MPDWVKATASEGQEEEGELGLINLDVAMFIHITKEEDAFTVDVSVDAAHGACEVFKGTEAECKAWVSSHCRITLE